MTSTEDGLVEQKLIDLLYVRLLELIESVTSNLYRHTLERLRKINPTLEELASICDSLIELLQAAGEQKVIQFREAVAVLREAAQAVGSGNLGTLTDCAYHLEQVVSTFRNS